MREFSAYEKYLIGNPTRSAAKHLFDCLIKGGPENAAWELIERYKGKNWRSKPGDMGQLCVDVIMALKAEYNPESVERAVPQGLVVEILDYLTDRQLQGDALAEVLNIKLMKALGLIGPLGKKS
jgi:hypothetical protein